MRAKRAENFDMAVWGGTQDFPDRGGTGRPELQKFGILVSRKPDISLGKSGHFQIFATNLCKFGIKGIRYC